MTIEAEGKRIELPKTKLSVVDGRLVRQSAADQITSDITVASITDVAAREEIEWVALWLNVVLLGAAAACKWLITSQGLSYFFAIGLAAIAILSLLGLKKPVLRVQTEDGEVTFDVRDSFPDAQAFALSLKQQARGAAAG